MSGPVGASPIVAGDIRVSEEREGAVLSCRVRGPGLPERLWFRVVPELATALAPTGDAFVPPLLLVAMSQNTRLVIEGEVSAALLATAPAIMEIFEQSSAVIGHPMCPVLVEAQARPAGGGRGHAAGAFFSGGIDSFYTVLRNLARYPPTDPRRITDLIFVHGFDIALADERLFAEVRDRLDGAARDLGTRLVPVTTNARIALAGLPWDYAHGAAMAAVGLGLARRLHTCYIAGAKSMRTSGFWGTHPGLDPLWSTETMEFVHDGAQLGRMVKARLVAGSPVALRVLRICWKNPGGSYNCGRCEKCMRTMILLTLCGSLERAETLPGVVDPEALAEVEIPAPFIGMWQGLGRRLAADGRHPDLLRALERALARASRRRPRLDQAVDRVFRALARIGLTHQRITWLDRRLLRGGGARAFRRLAGRG